MKIDLIAGARPNFIKISPIINAIKEARTNGHEIEYRLIHTGQHYDQNMSGSFFEQLDIPFPEENLGVGSGSQSEQTARIMIGYELLLLKKIPDFCLVVGDVNSTMACSIVAKKLNIKIVHVEAGIRSGDLTMPEEINRIVTDSITDYFFTTSDVANKNLINNGISKDRIFLVGNTMIDTLIKNRPNFKKPALWDKIGLNRRNYIIMTLHRPANVDDGDVLKKIINKVTKHSNDIQIIFPVHPRTKKKLKDIGITLPQTFCTSEPLGYLEFNYLVERALAVITDSGGITEETTVMNIPCMTIRDNTERPETIEFGTNELLGVDLNGFAPAMQKLFSGKWKKGRVPYRWDGKTAERIIKHLLEIK